MLVLLVSPDSMFEQLDFRHDLRLLSMKNIDLSLILIVFQILVLRFLVLFHQIIKSHFVVPFFIFLKIRMGFVVNLRTIQLERVYPVNRFVFAQNFIKASVRE